jgi:hypothetical protein
VLLAQSLSRVWQIINRTLLEVNVVFFNRGPRGCVGYETFVIVLKCVSSLSTREPHFDITMPCSHILVHVLHEALQKQAPLSSADSLNARHTADMPASFEHALTGRGMSLLLV